MSSRKWALKQKARASRAVHKSPHMKRPRLNRTENSKEDTAEECGMDLVIIGHSQYFIRIGFESPNGRINN